MVPMPDFTLRGNSRSQSSSKREKGTYEESGKQMREGVKENKKNTV
jgi:hypothetical protein